MANLTFVDEWDHPSILPSTIRLYSKKVPVREAAKQFAERVKRHYQAHEVCERISEDIDKSRFSQQEWSKARDQTIVQLDNVTKEPKSLLFSVVLFIYVSIMILNGSFVNLKCVCYTIYHINEIYINGEKSSC